jgi:hypothetical protein
MSVRAAAVRDSLTEPIRASRIQAFLQALAFVQSFSRSICIFLCFLSTASEVQWPEFLATDPEVRVRLPALPDFLRSSGFGTGSTQSLVEYN